MNFPRLSLCAATLVLLVSGPRARAADKPPAPSPAAKAEARQRFDEGVRLFEKGENAAAMAEFKRAYELIPNAVVLYNIGLVDAAMDRPVEAVDALDKVLADAKGLSPAQVQRAQQTRGEQSARVAEIAVVTDKPAVVEVDGVDAGRTPLDHPLRVASGTHVIAVLAPGALPARREITLAGRTAQTVSFTLLPAESSNGHLTLTVSVPGAEVLVNGKSIGLTPLAASVAVAPGAAAIEVRRPGYRNETRTVRVDEGSNGTLAIALEEDPAAAPSLKGRLRVTPSEPGALVSVDGAPRPDAVAGAVIVAGPHLLRVEHAGYLPFERTIDVGAGADTSLVADLVPTIETRAAKDESAHTRRIAGWSLVGGGAAVLIGSAVYAIATHGDVGSAQSTLDTYLKREDDLNDTCSSAPSNVGQYAISGCAAMKSADQDAVSSAKLKRDLAYGGIALGAVATGVGAYLLATLPRESAAAHVSLWGGGQSGGLVLSGRF
ncbi:MAG TPA: PEGA domain-containing protein [Polyangia bacterium]|nr:PEGA domain-containing protein [Polyangia bacterium]